MPGYYRDVGDQNIVANLIEFAKENLPPESLGPYETQMRWCMNGGLAGLEANRRVLFKLSQKNNWVDVMLETQGMSFDWPTGQLKD
jgi:hypothetical protein